MPAKTSYPSGREADVVLRDGSTVHVRPVLAGDEAELREFLESLSPDSRVLRFFSGGTNLRQAAQAAADVDYRRRYGLVATAGADAAIVAHAEYIATGGDEAEIAFEVSDAAQGMGLGTLLLAHLAQAAGENGITTFVAHVMPANHRMIEVFRKSGFATSVRSLAGILLVEFPTSVSPEAVAAFEHRDQVAAAAAVGRILAPSSVAVVGASRREGSIGGEILGNLVDAGFSGRLYPVNPHASELKSLPAYPSIGEVPGDVELAVIAVPAEHVVDVARECGAKGVGALLVISAGFAETGPDGVARQAELLSVCRQGGMRLVGPNCLGVVNTAPDVRLNATFAPSFPAAGRVGFMSQSGALGLALIDRAQARGVGLSSFVSVGNKADISGNDLLQYWETDDRTGVIVLYLESFGDPRRFARIARRVGRSKPIVALKSGRSKAGARAASSHTGALVAASDVTVDTLFRQSGVIRSRTLRELLDVTSLLANQPLPGGKRVAIVTNSGGPAIMCADACADEGLELPELAAETRDRLAAQLPRAASVANPVDMLATASGEDYRQTIELVAQDPSVDAVIAIFTPPLGTPPADVASAIRGASGGDVPLLGVFISTESTAPMFSFPEEAARALGHAVRYSEWRQRAEAPAPGLTDTDPDAAAAAIASALARNEEWLSPDDVSSVLGAYGLPLIESLSAADPTAAGAAAQRLGGRVALKAVSPTLVHKSDAHGVRLGLVGAGQVSLAAGEMRDELEAAGHELSGFLVQRLLQAPVAELLIGVTNDPTFGPLLVCGAGGTTAELLKDVSVRLTPIDGRDAAEMLRSLRTFPLLDGYRGAPKADVAALENVLLRLSALVEAHAEIVELDLNPVMALGEGAVIVDARIRVAAASPPRPWPALRSPTPERGL
jgi:acetyl coenzyme A synthetase (ADP forming)-like protein